VASGAGLRQGEAFGLRAEDVDFLGRRLNVRQQIKLIGGIPTLAPPKRSKTREVPLAEVVAVALSQHLRKYESGEDGLFFTSREHKPMARTYFNQHIWKPALAKGGVEPTRENGKHALRHYFASVLLDAGESIRAVSDYLGHSDPGFTLRVYTHLMPASEDRARRAIDAAFSSSRVQNVSDGAR
jgi:integrase